MTPAGRGTGREMNRRRWTNLQRQAATLILLLVAMLGTVSIGLEIADNEWPRWWTLVGAPIWWWLTIYRIAQDVLTETAERSEAGLDHLCEVMHDAYEAAALGSGWETQQASRKPWADVPESNKAATRAAVRALLEERKP